MTRHVVSPLTAKFALWAVRPGELEGEAHLTYSLRAHLIDTRSTTCPSQTEVVGPLSWDVQLKGHYFAAPDGSIRVMARASPATSPPYVEKFSDCPLPDRPQQGITWAVVAGTLVNGVADARHDLPVPPRSTGESYDVTHMQVSR